MRSLNKCLITILLLLFPPPLLIAQSIKSKVIAVIFCDLSTSIDTSSIQEVAKTAGRLFLKFPPGSKMYYYPIDESPFIKPIIIYEKPKRPRTTSEKERYMITERRKAREIYNRIVKLYYEVYYSPEARNRPISCMIRTLNTAHSIFSQHYSVNKNVTFELVYLSDMIEECQNSPIGPIYMHKKNYSIIKKRLSSYRPNFNLSFANISIIRSFEKYATLTSYVSSEKLEELWKIIFMKVGFTRSQADSIEFFPTIPPRFENYERVMR